MGVKCLRRIFLDYWFQFKSNKYLCDHQKGTPEFSFQLSKTDYQKNNINRKKIQICSDYFYPDLIFNMR